MMGRSVAELTARTLLKTTRTTKNGPARQSQSDPAHRHRSDHHARLPGAIPPPGARPQQQSRFWQPSTTTTTVVEHSNPLPLPDDDDDDGLSEMETETLTPPGNRFKIVPKVIVDCGAEDEDEDLVFQGFGEEPEGSLAGRTLRRVRGLFKPTLLSLPIYAAMVAVGLVYRDACPMNVEVPRYLFFSGMAGLCAVTLRLVMLAKWCTIKDEYAKNVDQDHHPAFNMIRCCMYLFLGVVGLWNVIVTPSILGANPVYDDPAAFEYCDAHVYKFALVLIILFNLLFTVCVLVTVVSMFAVICLPDMLIYHYYGEEILPPKINRYLPSWMRRVQKTGNGDLENGKAEKPQKVDLEMERSAGSNGDWEAKLSAGRTVAAVKVNGSPEPPRAVGEEFACEKDLHSGSEEHQRSLVRFASDLPKKSNAVVPTATTTVTSTINIMNFPTGPMRQPSTFKPEGPRSS